jgi:CRISPR-associated protein Cmr4
LAALAALEDDLFTHRFVVVDDDTMTFFWETATQVDARVRLDDATRTVAQGALWLEESLPPETLLIGLLAADRSRRPEMEMTPDAVLDFALPKEAILQFGGKATIGRGRCRIIPV